MLFSDRPISELLVVAGFGLLMAAQSTLLNRILKKRDCTGISGNTQKLYGIVFSTRLIGFFIKLPNFDTNSSLVSMILEIPLTTLTWVIVRSIFTKHSESYQREVDKFRLDLLIIPVALLMFGLGANLWCFNVFLESVAIFPQLLMIARAKRVEPHIHRYISLLAISKLLTFVGYFTSRFYMSRWQQNFYTIVGFVQFYLYFDFFMRDLPIVGKYQPFWWRSCDQQEIVNNFTNNLENFYSKEQEAISATQFRRQQQSFGDPRPPPYEDAVVLSPTHLMRSEMTRPASLFVVSTKQEREKEIQERSHE